MDRFNAIAVSVALLEARLVGHGVRQIAQDGVGPRHIHERQEQERGTRSHGPFEHGQRPKVCLERARIVALRAVDVRDVDEIGRDVRMLRTQASFPEARARR